MKKFETPVFTDEQMNTARENLIRELEQRKHAEHEVLEPEYFEWLKDFTADQPHITSSDLAYNSAHLDNETIASAKKFIHIFDQVYSYAERNLISASERGEFLLDCGDASYTMGIMIGQGSEVWLDRVSDDTTSELPDTAITLESLRSGETTPRALELRRRIDALGEYVAQQVIELKNQQVPVQAIHQKIYHALS